MKKLKKCEKDKLIKDYLKEYDPYQQPQMNICIADLVHYSQEKNVDPSELSEEEIAKFIVKKV